MVATFPSSSSISMLVEGDEAEQQEETIPPPSNADDSSADSRTNSEEIVKNPREGVIGRTPTPPSAPIPVYEKDVR